MVTSVEFLGSGDATDFALGQTSALFTGSCRILIDCGPQVPAQLACRLAAEELDGVYLTHTHADHCFGLPALLLWMRQYARRRPLALFAEPKLLSTIFELLELGYPGAFAPAKCFPIQVHPLAQGATHEYGRARFKLAPTAHNSPNWSLRIDDGGFACAFSGDGLPTELTARLFGGVDLLVHECEFFDRASPNHSNVAAVADLIRKTAPGRVAVVHCASGERALIESKLAAEFGDLVVFPQVGTREEFR